MASTNLRTLAVRSALAEPSASSWQAAAGGVLVEVTKPRESVLAALELPTALVPGGEPAAEARSAPPAAALGNNADFASAPPLLPPATVSAFHLRSHGRELLLKAGVSKRIRWCGSRISRNADGVGLYRRPGRAYGRVHGVCVCGQSLACPVCAPRIAARRAEEVSEAYSRARAAGYEARLLTFTMPHTLGSTLGHEIDTFAAAWRSLNSGRSAARRNAAAESLGHHVGREVTFGDAHGWHYHHHVLRYDAPGSFCGDRWHADWLSAIEGQGRKWRGAELHAFHVGVVGDRAQAAYCAKLALAVEAQARAVGSEIASAATKGSNLATLLRRYVSGDRQAGRTWVAGVQDITQRKVSSVRWSRGLRARLGLADEETDEQIAEDRAEKGDEFLGALTPMQWRGVLAWRAEFSLLVAANAGRDAVNAFLAGLELGQLDDAARPAVVVPLEAETCYKGFAPVVAK